VLIISDFRVREKTLLAQIFPNARTWFKILLAWPFAMAGLEPIKHSANCRRTNDEFKQRSIPKKYNE